MARVWRCLECGEDTESQDDLLSGPLYECEDCGTKFTRDNSADGSSHRCPDCNKFGSKAADEDAQICPECEAGEVEETEVEEAKLEKDTECLASELGDTLRPGQAYWVPSQGSPVLFLATETGYEVQRPQIAEDGTVFWRTDDRYTHRKIILSRHSALIPDIEAWKSEQGRLWGKGSVCPGVP